MKPKFSLLPSHKVACFYDACPWQISEKYKNLKSLHILYRLAHYTRKALSLRLPKIPLTYFKPFWGIFYRFILKNTNTIFFWKKYCLRFENTTLEKLWSIAPTVFRAHLVWYLLSYPGNLGDGKWVKIKQKWPRRRRRLPCRIIQITRVINYLIHLFCVESALMRFYANVRSYGSTTEGNMQSWPTVLFIQLCFWVMSFTSWLPFN